MFNPFLSGIKKRIAITCTLLFSVHCGMQVSIKSLYPTNEAQSVNQDVDESDKYWDLIEEKVQSPGTIPQKVSHHTSWFLNDITPGGFSYVYGGKTATKVQKGSSKEYSGILACYFDNEEYSGVSISLGDRKKADLESLRKGKSGGLAFWAKGAKGGESMYLGFIDDETDGMKVQSKLALRDFGKIDTGWTYFMIPLKKIPDKGRYWDATKKSEVSKDIDWKSISEIRFSVNKGENSRYQSMPVKFYIEHLSIIDEIPGYFDADTYWETFSSDKPDLVMHNLENPTDHLWVSATGPASKISFEIVKSKEKENGQKSIAISYQLNDWCDVVYDYVQNSTPTDKRNWTGYWGLKINLYSTRPFQSITIQVADAGNELYVASCGGPEGWSEQIVPFKNFQKFPYYQPLDAVHNGTFDLDNVRSIDIKPSGEGSAATFKIDNITLTNNRIVRTAAVVASKSVTIQGSLSKVITEKVNDGIFGTNMQFWDTDLLAPATADFVKKVNHSVIRLPGGLSSDEYHWKEANEKKNQGITTDEFLDFCDKTGCKPMITVNFGTGTPQEAAEWVKYVNIVKKKNVKLWEVGNELYGSWHKNHCSAQEYGKRAAEFIIAMKKVDPSILVTVVWELEGQWNKTVFDFTKGLADGVNVHNYPQESGEENDIALLSSPQTLDNIIASVKKQLLDYGHQNKNYQIWLTEWNSVDFNPGPQSLGIVNALFVADYLGMMAKHNIENANYWNIHNNIFDQGGDYGYLSRSDAPEGPNVPRPSYWAFKLSSESLRGKLVDCYSSDKNVTSYTNIHPDGSKSILLINKYPQTTADMTIMIPGLTGEAVMSQLTATSTAQTGPRIKPVTVKNGMNLKLPPYSISLIKF